MSFEHQPSGACAQREAHDDSADRSFSASASRGDSPDDFRAELPFVKWLRLVPCSARDRDALGSVP